MGIGNSRWGGAPCPSIPLITPHGDWKQPSRAHPLRPSCTHYPSWGLETPLHQLLHVNDTHSLPLMGIGNPRVAVGAISDTTLITPHGDWKRSHGSSRCSPPPSHYPSWGLETRIRTHTHVHTHHLITPHGDWKHLRVLLLQISRADSLPLMGIGNRTKSHPPPRKSRTHYPSWGLETWMTIIPKGSVLDSLPLMGIGNKASFSGSLCGLAISLPLMGIGNRERRAGSSTGSGSLPLMGIGNQALLDAAGVVPELITPHGDWKRPSHRGLRRTGQSHYPSWGLETRRGRLPRTPRGSSLPLMGIGNMPPATTSGTMKPTHYPSWGLETVLGGSGPTRATLAHYPSWGLETRQQQLLHLEGPPGSLPLMGIGNRTRNSNEEAEHASHYPSWGLETPRLGRIPATVNNHSLPLMGIGNGRAGREGGGVALLITPHGDWKLLKRQRFTRSRFLPAHAERHSFGPTVRLDPLPREVVCSGASAIQIRSLPSSCHAIRPILDSFAHPAPSWQV